MFWHSKHFDVRFLQGAPARKRGRSTVPDRAKGRGRRSEQRAGGTVQEKGQGTPVRAKGRGRQSGQRAGGAGQSKGQGASVREKGRGHRPGKGASVPKFVDLGGI